MKKLFISISVLVTLLIIALIALWLYVPSLLLSLEERAVDAARDQGFLVRYETIDWNLMGPSITISSLNVSRVDEALGQSESTFTMQIDSMYVKTRWSRILNKKYSSFTEVIAHGGKVHAARTRQLPETPPDSTNENLPANEVAIRIDHLDIQNFGVELTGSNPISVHLDHLSGNFIAQRMSGEWDFQIPDNQATLELSQFSIATLFAYHTFQLDSLMYQMHSQKAKATGLRIRPTHNRGVIDAEHPFMITHTSVTIPDIIITEINPEFGTAMGLRIGNIELNRVFLNLYQNMGKPIEDKKKQLPTAWIRNVDFPFLIDRIHVRQSRLNYTEVGSSETLNPANFWMDNWDMQWFGYGTHSDRPDSHHLTSNMVMMDGPRVEVEVDFPYEDTLFGFNLSGTIGETPFNKFNPILEPLEGFHFRSGELSQARFNFTGNDNLSSGELYIRYNDVRIALSRNPRFTDRAMAWVANRFVVRSNTEDDGMTVPIGMDRDQNRSVANFWAQSLKSGLIEVMQK
jgi:hypothetical protein